MLKCNACGAISADVHILEAEGGPMPDRGVVAVRIKICNSCYSRPERLQLLSQRSADILVPPSYWFGRNIAWSSAIRVVRSPRGQRAPRFSYQPEAHPLGYWTGPSPAGQRRQLSRVLSQAREPSLELSERGVTSNGPLVLFP